jgi:histidinol dehydrogenase
MIKTVLRPDKTRWDELCRRPLFQRNNIKGEVENILNEVRNHGDIALSRFSELFDSIEVTDFRVKKEEIDNAGKTLSNGLKEAIQVAKRNIEKFHKSQIHSDEAVETTYGVRCWRRSIAIDKVGLYIPGGNAPLFSTVLMLGIPAVIAGCKEIVLCSPPGKDGNINAAILYTAGLLGIKSVFKVGGAQAIAAMAYGTETIPRVDKIFGPGNQFVTKAKEIVQSEGVNIDMPAGPSEVLIIADDSSVPSFVAADLISQAEHGIDSHVVLLTNSLNLLGEVKNCIYDQLEELPSRTIAEQSLNGSMLILMSSIDECISFSNMYAPEHLIIVTTNAMKAADEITNAGSVFLGNFSCESAGDYASGTNHTLPTNGYAKSYSGLSVESFIKKISFQYLTARGLEEIGPSIETMAEAETLYGHKNAVSIRLNTINNDKY